MTNELKSYALDALYNLKPQQDGSVPPDKARRFITSAAKSRGEAHPSIGLGENIIFESRIILGATLVEKDRVLHLSAFKKEKKNGMSGIGYQRFSHRRRYR